MTNKKPPPPPPPSKKAEPAKPEPAKPPPGAEESRAHQRLPFEVSVDIVSEHNFFAGLSLNISEGGIFVATNVIHPVGTQLEIRLLLPADEEPTSLMTEVRWLRPRGEGKEAAEPGLGLVFVDPPPDVMKKITRFTRNREPLYYEE